MRHLIKSSLNVLVGPVLMAVIIAGPTRAKEVKAGDLFITQAWSRATPKGAQIAGGYLTIENKGSASDRIVGVSSDIAGKVDVHEMAMNNGVMKMRPLDQGLTIEAGKTVKLAPGGYHLMLMNLRGPLLQGDTVPITLQFEKAGKVTVSLAVQGVGAQGPSSADHSGDPVQMKTAPDRSAMKMSPPGDDDNFFTHIHTEKVMANVTVSPGHVGPVDLSIQLQTTEEVPLLAKAVTVALSHDESGIRLQPMRAVRIGDNHWQAKISMLDPGRWTLGLGISISETDKVNVEAPILIR
jgi:copper(I)-binding protein